MYHLLWNSSKKNEQKSVRQLSKYRVHQRMLVALVAEVPNLERAVGSAQEPCAAITAELKVTNYPVPVQLSRQLTVRLKISVDVVFALLTESQQAMYKLSGSAQPKPDKTLGRVGLHVPEVK